MDTYVIIDVYKDNPCPFVHVHSVYSLWKFITLTPSSLYHSLYVGNFSKIKAKFRGSLDDSSFRSVSPATHTHKSAIYIAVSHGIYSLLKDIRRQKRGRVFPWPRAISFFFIVRTRWAVGIFMAELFRMSDYITLRMEHIFRYMIDVIRSHIFSSFNMNFCANNPDFRSHDRITNQTTIIYRMHHLPVNVSYSC